MRTAESLALHGIALAVVVVGFVLLGLSLDWALKKWGGA